MRRLLLLAVFVTLPCAADAQPKKSPNPLSPDLMVVVKYDADKGKLRLRIRQNREQEIHEFSVGGGVSLKTEKVIGPYQIVRYLDVKKCKFLTASGKAVSRALLGKRLKAGAAVVVTNTGKAPARTFLQILRPETIVIVGPPAKLDPRVKSPPSAK